MNAIHDGFLVCGEPKVRSCKFDLVLCACLISFRSYGVGRNGQLQRILRVKCATEIGLMPIVELSADKENMCSREAGRAGLGCVPRLPLDMKSKPLIRLRPVWAVLVHNGKACTALSTYHRIVHLFAYENSFIHFCSCVSSCVGS